MPLLPPRGKVVTSPLHVCTAAGPFTLDSDLAYEPFTRLVGAMEKTRLALAAIGRLIFTQSTELVNPAMNRGLPPSLAASDPSLNYHAKGLDVATAAYASELAYLASPVSTHIQSAEMHNQAVK